MRGEERRLMRNLNEWMIAWAVLHTVALVMLKRHSQFLAAAAYAVAAAPVAAGSMAPVPPVIAMWGLGVWTASRRYS